MSARSAVFALLLAHLKATREFRECSGSFMIDDQSTNLFASGVILLAVASFYILVRIVKIQRRNVVFGLLA